MKCYRRGCPTPPTRLVFDWNPGWVDIIQGLISGVGPTGLTHPACGPHAHAVDPGGRLSCRIPRGLESRWRRNRRARYDRLFSGLITAIRLEAAEPQG